MKDSTRRTLKLSDAFYEKSKKLFENALALAGKDKLLKEKIEYDYINILFYRLELMPPVGEKDKVQYVKVLDQFKELTTKYKVKWITEKTTKTSARIVEWKRKYDIVSADDKPVTLVLSTMDTSKVGNGAKRYDDITVPGGKYIKLPMAGKEWAVQWFFGSALFKGVKYSARIQVRIDKKKDKGTAIFGGIHSLALKKSALKVRIDASEFTGNAYKWIDCGTFDGGSAATAYFYLAQSAGSAATNVYITRIELIPQLSDKK